MSVDEMVAALDERHGHRGWDVYRAHDARWAAIVEVDKHSLQSGSTIAEAMQALLNYRPIPVVPRARTIVDRAGFSVWQKDGMWRLSYYGEDCGAYHTEREAHESADRLWQRSIEKSEHWSRTYGPIVATGTAGVDFRWAE